MIDVNLPIELDDGRPASITRKSMSGRSILVEFNGPLRCDGNPSILDKEHWFSLKNGFVDGDWNKKTVYHSIRNVEPEGYYDVDLDL